MAFRTVSLDVDPEAQFSAVREDSKMRGPSESYTDSAESGYSNAWTACATDVWNRDKDMVDKWNREIDTLLVFAGLFSAVVTSFNVQYYPQLQTSTPPKASAITINALWFVALVLSLGAASIAINVKQWLTNYVAPDTVDAYQRVRLWSLRHHGLMAWNVPEIIALLPLLLQSALTFFLAGLLVLLWTLDIAVACCVAVPVAALLSFSGATLAIPALAADCPYRSPQAWWISYLLEKLRQARMPFIHRKSINAVKDISAHTWVDLDVKKLQVSDSENSVHASTEEELIALIEFAKVRAPAALPSPHGEAFPQLRWHASTDGRAVVELGKLALDILNRWSVAKFQDPLSASSIMTAKDVKPMHTLSLINSLFPVIPSSQLSLYAQLAQWLHQSYISIVQVNGPPNVALSERCIWSDAVEILCHHTGHFQSGIQRLKIEECITLAYMTTLILEGTLLQEDQWLAYTDQQNLLQLLENILGHTKLKDMHQFLPVYGVMCHALEANTNHLLKGKGVTKLSQLVCSFAEHFIVPSHTVTRLASCLEIMLSTAHSGGDKERNYTLDLAEGIQRLSMSLSESLSIQECKDVVSSLTSCLEGALRTPRDFNTRIGPCHAPTLTLCDTIKPMAQMLLEAVASKIPAGDATHTFQQLVSCLKLSLQKKRKMELPIYEIQNTLCDTILKVSQAASPLDNIDLAQNLLQLLPECVVASSEYPLFSPVDPQHPDLTYLENQQTAVSQRCFRKILQTLCPILEENPHPGFSGQITNAGHSIHTIATQHRASWAIQLWETYPYALQVKEFGRAAGKLFQDFGEPSVQPKPSNWVSGDYNQGGIQTSMLLGTWRPVDMTGRIIEHEQASNVERVGNVELPHDAVVPHQLPDSTQATPRLRRAEHMHGDVAAGHYTGRAERHVVIIPPDLKDSSSSSLDSARSRHAMMPRNVPDPARAANATPWSRGVHRRQAGGTEEEHTTSAEKHAAVETPDITDDVRPLDSVIPRHATTSQHFVAMPQTDSIHTVTDGHAVPEGLRTAIDHRTQPVEEEGEEGDTVLYPQMGRPPIGDDDSRTDGSHLVSSVAS